MTGDGRGGDRVVGVSLARKVALTAATGLLAFVASELLDGPLDVPLGQQLVLSTLVGGITLLTQFLHDFDRRIEDLEVRQAANLVEAHEVINGGFARISDATRFFSHVEGSALSNEALTELVHRAGRLNSTRPELLRDLAHHEVERVSFLLKCLADGDEVFYDGEDRDWLLGLTRYVSSSIAATSLATVDAGVTSADTGLWMNDLGGRYLDLQRAAVERGVRVRRIFVFDQYPGLDQSDFLRVYQLHQAAGVEVRSLDSTTVPTHLKNMVFDFVVFDSVLSYETTPATWMDRTGKPAIVTTRLVLDAERVHSRASRFEGLWAASTPALTVLQGPAAPGRGGQRGSASEPPTSA